jgi:hypothetical protein
MASDWEKATEKGLGKEKDSGKEKAMELETGLASD